MTLEATLPAWTVGGKAERLFFQSASYPSTALIGRWLVTVMAARQTYLPPYRWLPIRLCNGNLTELLPRRSRSGPRFDDEITGVTWKDAHTNDDATYAMARACLAPTAQADMAWMDRHCSSSDLLVNEVLLSSKASSEVSSQDIDYRSTA